MNSLTSVHCFIADEGVLYLSCSSSSHQDRNDHLAREIMEPRRAEWLAQGYTADNQKRSILVQPSPLSVSPPETPADLIRELAGFVPDLPELHSQQWGGTHHGAGRLQAGWRSPSDMAQPVGGQQMCSGLEAARFYTEARRSNGLALLGASVTREVSGSKSPAFEGQDGDPRWTVASQRTT